MKVQEGLFEELVFESAQYRVFVHVLNCRAKYEHNTQGLI